MGWPAGKKVKSIPVFEEHSEPHHTPAALKRYSAIELCIDGGIGKLFSEVKLMSWNSSKPWLAILVLSLLTGTSSAQVPNDPRPKSILDYYFLLPHKYLPYLKADSRPVREAAIQIKDLDGGFLKAGLATDEVSTALALFKKSDGSDLIAVENRSCRE